MSCPQSSLSCFWETKVDRREPRPSCLINDEMLFTVKNQLEAIDMSRPTWLYCISFLASVPLLPRQENNRMCQPRCIEHITEVQSNRFHTHFYFTRLQCGSLAPEERWNTWKVSATSLSGEFHHQLMRLQISKSTRILGVITMKITMIPQFTFIQRIFNFFIRKKGTPPEWMAWSKWYLEGPVPMSWIPPSHWGKALKLVKLPRRGMCRRSGLEVSSCDVIYIGNVSIHIVPG